MAADILHPDIGKFMSKGGFRTTIDSKGGKRGGLRGKKVEKGYPTSNRSRALGCSHVGGAHPQPPTSARSGATGLPRMRCSAHIIVTQFVITKRCMSRDCVQAFGIGIPRGTNVQYISSPRRCCLACFAPGASADSCPWSCSAFQTVMLGLSQDSQR